MEKLRTTNQHPFAVSELGFSCPSIIETEWSIKRFLTGSKGIMRVKWVANLRSGMLFCRHFAGQL
jgi:hypothetical protein